MLSSQVGLYMPLECSCYQNKHVRDVEFGKKYILQRSLIYTKGLLIYDCLCFILYIDCFRLANQPFITAARLLQSFKCFLRSIIECPANKTSHCQSFLVQLSYDKSMISSVAKIITHYSRSDLTPKKELES